MRIGSEGAKMESEGPYFIDKDGYITGPTGKHDFVTLDTLKVFNSVFECGKSEGRKAAESYTEKMLKFATDEVRKCHTEIRRLEDKYARNFYRMPIPLDEELAKKARGIE